VKEENAPPDRQRRKTMEYPGNSTNGSTKVTNDGVQSSDCKSATAQQLIRENVQYLIAQLEAGHSEALTAFLDAVARFHHYSLGNVLLIARQRPGATHVAGMRTWNQLGPGQISSSEPFPPLSSLRQIESTGSRSPPSGMNTPTWRDFL
jgi:hypothetical protein